jgi:hypothetical protein
MSLQISSLLVYPVGMMHPEFLNKKNPDPLLPSVLSRNYEPSTSKDSLSNPCLINLETIGLWRSPRIAELNGVTQDGPAIAAYTSSTMQLKSRRTTRLKPKLSFLSVFNSVGALWAFATTNPHSDYEHLSFVAQIANDFEQINGLFDDTINEIRHHIQAYTTSNEIFTYFQMLREDDRVKFFKAMEVKINNHKTRHNWNLMLHKDLPLGTKTIMVIWSFKCKRFPEGTLNKHKARLCAHGGQQTWGQDYWDTYAPVVTWASVRLLLIVAKIHELKSKSIDFVLASTKADLDAPVYMELPDGVNPTNVSDGDWHRYVLKLNKRPQASWL